jgi:hypothetical protein
MGWTVARTTTFASPPFASLRAAQERLGLGSTSSVAELATQPDANFLQVVNSGDLVGYSRALGVADPKYMREHFQRYGGPTPPPFDHDGIDDIFVGKGSVVWYWSEGRWLQLQGANYLIGRVCPG